ncbi:rRNA-processing protein Fcf1/Utp23 like protein [Aduncisulcus paluster]|uniref:rRNA-processing protein Fcf1/Utp23 like protein n=1 Tax=Aduncisulcus paluster TaxID=2918883 RepID=A0ABQ5JVE0_9EUKA|nr:rRNA-processing protein Fcf1/Utp23 like protein [Aduncisulcus paluster]
MGRKQDRKIKVALKEYHMEHGLSSPYYVFADGTFLSHCQKLQYKGGLSRFLSKMFETKDDKRPKIHIIITTCVMRELKSLTHLKPVVEYIEKSDIEVIKCSHESGVSPNQCVCSLIEGKDPVIEKHEKSLESQRLKLKETTSKMRHIKKIRKNMRKQFATDNVALKKEVDRVKEEDWKKMSDVEKVKIAEMRKLVRETPLFGGHVMPSAVDEYMANRGPKKHQRTKRAYLKTLKDLKEKDDECQMQLDELQPQADTLAEELRSKQVILDRRRHHKQAEVYKHKYIVATVDPVMIKKIRANYIDVPILHLINHNNIIHLMKPLTREEMEKNKRTEQEEEKQQLKHKKDIKKQSGGVTGLEIVEEKGEEDEEDTEKDEERSESFSEKDKNRKNESESKKKSTSKDHGEKKGKKPKSKADLFGIMWRKEITEEKERIIGLRTLPSLERPPISTLERLEQELADRESRMIEIEHSMRKKERRGVNPLSIKKKKKSKKDVPTQKEQDVSVEDEQPKLVEDEQPKLASLVEHSGKEEDRKGVIFEDIHGEEEVGKRRTAPDDEPMESPELGEKKKRKRKRKRKVHHDIE